MAEYDPDFLAHVEELEAAHGIELSDDELDALADASTEHGGDPEATEAAFAELAELEPEQPEADLDEVEQDVEPGLALNDTFRQDATSDLQRLEAKLGRRLTQRELDATAANMAEQAQRYDQIDAQAALDSHVEQGGRRYDLDSDSAGTRREARRSWMAERYADEQRAHQPEPAELTFDPDNATREQRVEYYAQRLAGAEFEDAPADET